MAWGARPGLKPMKLPFSSYSVFAGYMAWGARPGLKRACILPPPRRVAGLNGLGSPSGIETTQGGVAADPLVQRLNGLGSPSGIETQLEAGLPIITSPAK